jgi:hypothetical protein
LLYVPASASSDEIARIKGSLAAAQQCIAFVLAVHFRGRPEGRQGIQTLFREMRSHGGTIESRALMSISEFGRPGALGRVALEQLRVTLSELERDTLAYLDAASRVADVDDSPIDAVAGEGCGRSIGGA